jgi:ParB family chromosome partitioning protein
MNSQRIRLDAIEQGTRLRAVDPAYVEFLAASMAEKQLTPIDVRPAAEAGRYRLIAGAHRFRAAAFLQWNEIDAVVHDVDDLTAELHEIDENLIRRELTELDRSVFLARRKEIHEALHPQTKHGGDRRSKQTDSGGHLIGSFSAEVAERLSLSERTIRRAVGRYLRIIPDVRQKIGGTWLADHGAQLDALAKLDGDTQRRVVALLFDAANPPPNVAAAKAAVRGDHAPVRDIDAEQLLRLREAWRKAGAKARERHIDDLVAKFLVLRRCGKP